MSIFDKSIYEKGSKVTICLLLMIGMMSSLAFAGEWTTLRNAEEPFTVEVLESDGNQTILHYTVNKYLTDEISIDGWIYTLMCKLEKESMIEEKGHPRLPRINRSLIIPDVGEMQWELVSADYIEVHDIDIAPSKGHLLRTVDPQDVPFTFADMYHQDAWFPAETVHLRTPYILRDFRGMVVEFNAFQYHPVRRILRICTNAVIKIQRGAHDGENVLVRRKPLSKIDSQFLKMYQRHFINFEQLDYPYLPDLGGMLVICYGDFMPDMEPFVQWKIQKGIPTTIVPVSEVGQDPETIKRYIRDYYLGNDVTFVLLVGDHPQIPTYLPGSDPMYSLLEGNDHYPEIFIGRFSAETSEQVQTQVERTVTYEKYPDPDGSWYHKGLGDADESGPCNPEQYDYQHITNIALDLLQWNYTQVDSVYTVCGGTTQMITDYLNDGRSILNYAGHGWMFGMGPVDFTSAQVNLLENDYMLPHIVTIACNVGEFMYITCFAETWLRATNEITGAPTGAIAVYMSTIAQTWFPPYDMQDEGIDLLVADSVVTFGGLCFNGAGLMVDLHPIYGEYEFDNWTIFGDPSVYLRSAAPYELNVEYDSLLVVGSSTLDVSVQAPGGPLEGAMVCAINDDVYASGITGESGEVTLIFDPPPIELGMLTLTVTHGNPIPYIADVMIIPSDGPYVIPTTQVIQDDFWGNGNGQLDYSERIDLGIEAENVGSGDATNVSATLTTQDSLVAILQDSVEIGNMLAGASVFLDRAFELELDPCAPDSSEIEFTIYATDGVSTWPTSFTLLAHAPVMSYQELIVEDPAGNYNHILDPEETADFQISIKNDGSCALANLSALLSTEHAHINIPNNTVSLDMLAVGAETTLVYPDISADPFASQGDTVAFALNITGWGEYSCTLDVATVVGDYRLNPIGPDEYGYYAYDSYDLPGGPEFNWTEIAPLAGGGGVNLELGDWEAANIPLPFTFPFYGNEYAEVNVCSDGWASLGDPNVFPPGHFWIPNITPPNSMIAPLWDETLNPELGGEVCHYFDEVNHTFIIEWYDIPHTFDPALTETFQIIICDPVHYPTTTGDGEIFVNYLTYNCPDDACTVGIEDSGGTTGIQVVYNGSYDPKAMPLEDHLSIKYTTIQSVLAVEPNSSRNLPVEYSLLQNYPNPFNPLTTISYHLPEAGLTKLMVYDLQGRLVADLVSGWRDAGVHEVTFDASNLASGVYIYRLIAGGYTASGKMVLLK